MHFTPAVSKSVKCGQPASKCKHDMNSENKNIIKRNKNNDRVDKKRESKKSTVQMRKPGYTRYERQISTVCSQWGGGV